MSPRRNRRRDHAEPPRPASRTAPIPAPVGWSALRHFGAAPGTAYTCPRCSRDVGRDAEHVVAWADDDPDRRRHWHAACWESAKREGLGPYRY